MTPTTITRIEQNNDSTYTFWFTPEKTFDYSAGQFVEVFIPHEADDRGTHRWFTLSSSPTEKLLAITTRKVSKMSSFKHQLFSLKVGDQLLISQAMGDFVLPMQRSIPIIFLVRGIGITPVRSMTKFLSDTGTENRDISVIHNVKHSDDLLFKSIYDTVASQTVSEVEKDNDVGKKMTLLAKEQFDTKPGSRVYISGPEVFVEESNHRLIELGLKPSQIVTDYFHGYNA